MFDAEATAILANMDNDLDGMVEVAVEAITEADRETAVTALSVALILLPAGFIADIAFSAVLRLADQKVAADAATALAADATEAAAGE